MRTQLQRSSLISTLQSLYIPFSISAEPYCAAFVYLLSFNSTLEDSLFDCAALPPCELSCSGPSKPLLIAFSRRCGCHAEWLFHSVALQVN